MINIFTLKNDTRSWALCVDECFGLFPTQAEAERVERLLGGSGDASDGLAETPFQYAVILSPGYRPLNCEARLSELQPVDIEDYINRKREEERNRPLPENDFSAFLGLK